MAWEAQPFPTHKKEDAGCGEHGIFVLTTTTEDEGCKVMTRLSVSLDSLQQQKKSIPCKADTMQGRIQTGRRSSTAYAWPNMGAKHQAVTETDPLPLK